ncbi:dienelactone hydrolase family protein [Salinifilum ghardaiensis]
MGRSVTNAFDELSRRGPHEVLHGDLSLVGLPGVLCTPRSGLGLPAIAFGHGWLQPPRRYLGLLRHLASWGFVVAAPATQGGVFASHRSFAGDLRTALDICVHVRLGDGGISVDERRLGLSGHAMGGGCSVLAAGSDSRVRAVAAAAPAQTLPSMLDVAPHVSAPGLFLAGGNDLLAPANAHAMPLARAWGGSVQLRTLPKASHLGYAEGRHWSELLLHGRPEHRTQRITKALFTAFFLRTLAGDKRGAVLLAEKLKGTELDSEHTRGELAAA